MAFSTILFNCVGGTRTKWLTFSDLVNIARTQIGTQEDDKHQNKSSSIEKYQACTGLSGQGWPWCAAFVDWCVQQFAEEAGTDITNVPKTAAAFGLIKWGNDNQYQVFNPPVSPKDIKAVPGDIVIYEFSHAGIVSRAGDAKYNFYAIEGNTNPGGGREGYEVAERGRNYSSVRKFIRLPVA